MPKTITASVGLQGKNLENDTRTVQELLNNVPVAAGGPAPKLDPDGKCGPITRKAIQMFQLKQFGWSGADSRVDPNGATLVMLNAYSPDPVAPKPPPVQPAPEPLSSEYLIWLRKSGPFFSHPYDANEFVFTIFDVANNRNASYGLRFNGKLGVAPPITGSGGHTAKVVLRTPVTISGLGGQSVYQSTMKKGSGKPEERLSSKLVVALDGGNALVARFGCHILKPTPDGSGVSGASDPAATPQFDDGNFSYNLQSFFVKL